MVDIAAAVVVVAAAVPHVPSDEPGVLSLRQLVRRDQHIR